MMKLLSNFKTIFTHTKTIKLGRWEHRESQHISELKSIWANSDNCGDTLCGNKKNIRQIIDIQNKKTT